MADEYTLPTQATTSLEKPIVVKGSVVAWSIFITGILYYCFAYLLRVYPSVMENDLLAHFNITASAFGNLAACYYYAYAPMQIPVGMTVDRFGVRKSLIFACSVAIFGVFIFIHATVLPFAELGRFLIGFGAAFAYVTVLKLATLWLPRNYFATATGVATGCGMLAAVFTDISLTRLIQTTGYKSALYVILGIGFVLLFLIFSVIRDKPNPISTSSTNTNEGLSFNKLGPYLLLLVKNPQMWLIGIVGALMYLPASVFVDVWGIPYLKAVYHLTPDQAALGVSMTLLGWILSSPIAGMLSDKLKTRKWPLVISAFVAGAIAAIIFYIPGIPLAFLYLLLFSLGVFCSPHPLCFTLGKENNSSKIAGSAIAFTNFLIMFGGVIFQPIVGKILDHVWTGNIANGIRIYTASEYTVALSILPLGLLLSGILTLLLRETFYLAVDKQTDDE